MNTRDHYMMNRSTKVMNFLRQPRSMAEIMEHFDYAPQARYAVYNLVKRGMVLNLVADPNAKGLYVVAERSAREAPFSSAACRDLQQAWRAQA
jgi:hypothetical protein